jgi:alcohol dehydrogenase class IV
LHHGTLNAMFLPAVVRFNAEAESVQRDRRMQRMALAMGLGEIKHPLQAAEAIALARPRLHKLNLAAQEDIAHNQELFMASKRERLNTLIRRLHEQHC